MQLSNSPQRRAETATVFAKVSPAQKAAIIDALHRKGHVVGYLGDGINDGLALKAADVGISVDSAVDIAKDSADIILLEKSVDIVGWNGGLREVVQQVVGEHLDRSHRQEWQEDTGAEYAEHVAEIGTRTHLYVFGDVAEDLAPFDNAITEYREYLAVPRRWDIGNITKVVLLIGPISSIFDYITYFTMLYVFNAWGNPALFQTGWFVESLLTQTLIIHGYDDGRRNERRAGPAFQKRNLRRAQSA